LSKEKVKRHGEHARPREAEEEVPATYAGDTWS